MNRVFTIEQLRPIKDGMTISRDAKMGTATGVTFFSLGKDTSISQEYYDATAVYIGAKGDATFLIGENADKKNFTEGDCLIVPGGTLCGMETVTGTVYTEMIIKRENTMNNIIKSGEVMKLKDLISYEEGSIANLDVVSNDTMKFVLMAFDEGTVLPLTAHLEMQLFLHWKEKQPSATKEKTTPFLPEKISVLTKMVFTALPQKANSKWLYY